MFANGKKRGNVTFYRFQNPFDSANIMERISQVKNNQSFPFAILKASLSYLRKLHNLTLRGYQSSNQASTR